MLEIKEKDQTLEVHAWSSKEGETVEKILIKQGFNSFKKAPDRIALSDDEAISLVGVLVKKYPQLREAITAL